MRVKPESPVSDLVNGDISGEPIDLDLVFLPPPSIGEIAAGRTPVPEEANAHCAVAVVLRFRDRGEKVDLLRKVEILPRRRQRDVPLVEIDDHGLAQSAG